MKKLESEKLEKLMGGIMSMEAYCQQWEGVVRDNMWDNNIAEIFNAMAMMAAGKCENPF